jgi:hypothetical protein
LLHRFFVESQLERRRLYPVPHNFTAPGCVELCPVDEFCNESEPYHYQEYQHPRLDAKKDEEDIVLCPLDEYCTKIILFFFHFLIDLFCSLRSDHLKLYRHPRKTVKQKEYDVFKKKKKEYEKMNPRLKDIPMLPLENDNDDDDDDEIPILPLENDDNKEKESDEVGNFKSCPCVSFVVFNILIGLIGIGLLGVCLYFFIVKRFHAFSILFLAIGFIGFVSIICFIMRSCGFKFFFFLLLIVISSFNQMCVL